MPRLTLKELFELNVDDRASYINDEAEKITLSQVEPDKNLKKAKKTNFVLTSYLHDLFSHKQKKYSKYFIIDKKEDFLKKELRTLSEQWIIETRISLDENRKPTNNVFGISGAYVLSVISKQTRVVTESLGHLFEDFACVSPDCISPENIFGVKLVGVDLIIRLNDSIYGHVQLKTAENTLTGSQAPRMKKELGIYNNPHFVASIKTGNGWTTGALSSYGIKRIRGEEFWSIIKIPYELVLNEVKYMMLNIQDYIVNNQGKSSNQNELRL